MFPNNFRFTDLSKLKDDGWDEIEGLKTPQNYDANNLDHSYAVEEHPSADTSEESEYSDEDSLDYDDSGSSNSYEDSE